MSETDEPLTERLTRELGELEREEKKLAQAIARAYLAIYKRFVGIVPSRPDVATEEDVALVREAKRDVGRARQVIEGVTRNWNWKGSPNGKEGKP